MANQTVSVLRTRDDQVIPVAGIYEIDAPHTSVEFVGRHLMITKVRGRFNDVRGQITIGEEPEKSHVEVEIAVASLSSGNDDRDGHLKSADFFDVDHYPTITFASTAVTPLLDNTWALVGDLTVRGTTRRRLQRSHRHQPRGLRARLERGARNRRTSRRQDRPHRIGCPSHRGHQSRGLLTAHFKVLASNPGEVPYMIAVDTSGSPLAR